MKPFVDFQNVWLAYNEPMQRHLRAANANASAQRAADVGHHPFGESLLVRDHEISQHGDAG